ncbi:hypothetical protein K491DRAFT_621281 [Lophiostoma macrostomum CBS 122681]|uniref:Uncharacterized protein n=1 Tax=Lophiostoma macrostomum CBS 122681 TaxID=1314788 RepID=A0A6A6TJX9_9PLEO|nr:hypothetical protein K491DRAFT_621281 [Lophiostoma macrostomum CBS 122681]
MSDYGDDYFSDDDAWLYVEDEYTQADDLAEHALPSPPPTAYADEDDIADFDLFDYFNDIEYASDGYDEGNFQPHDSKAATTGQKRKRTGVSAQGRKKQKLGKSANASPTATRKPELPPVVWRAQNERGLKPKMLVDDVKPFAFLKDWRTKLADTPSWALGKSRTATPSSTAAELGNGESMPAPLLADVESLDGDEGAPAIDQDVILAALRNKLGGVGGPLAGMDEQTLLQFAMRMLNGEDDGDDIAGEMADNILGQGEGDDDDEEGDGDGEASAEHLAWLARMRGGEASTSGTPKSPLAKTNGGPPTPPSSEPNHRVRIADGKDVDALNNSTATIPSRKRKADGARTESDSAAPKKQRSFNAPTASSQAKAVPVSTATRGSRGKRPGK